MSWNILSKTNLQYLLTRLKEVIPKISANPQTTTATLNSIEIDGTAYDIQGSGEPNVQSDWNESDSTSDTYIQNKPTLATVATSGSYNDLSNKPTIPTNNNQLTNGAGYITSSGTAANVSGTVAIANGGTGATTRLGALQNLTNENVGTGTQHFLTITNSWAKGGWCSVADAKTVLGLGSAAYLNASDTATNSTVVKRTASGYVFASYFNGSSGAENINSYTSYPLFASSDGYFRKTTKAYLQTFLGVPLANSATWGSDVTNSVATGTETTICQIASLAAGTYLFTGEFTWSTSFDAQYNTKVAIVSQDEVTSRTNGLNGGGACVTFVATLSVARTIRLTAWQGSGSTRAVSGKKLVAVRLY